MNVKNCEKLRPELLDLLGGQLEPENEERLRAHLASCDECSQELQVLRASWESLPDSVDAEPPRRVGAQILAYAGGAVVEPVGLLGGIRAAIGGVAGPVLMGTAAALAVVSVAYVRGALAPHDQTTVVALSLALAAALALAAGGLQRGGIPRSVRAALTGSLGAFGGYFILTLALPIADTVQYCGTLVFGSVRLSLGQICVVYLSVAALYAGIPMAIASYAWGGTETGARVGIAEALVFAVIAMPLVLLQLGFSQWLITLAVGVGFAVGAVGGGVAGRWTHDWVLEGATG